MFFNICLHDYNVTTTEAQSGTTTKAVKTEQVIIVALDVLEQQQAFAYSLGPDQMLGLIWIQTV